MSEKNVTNNEMPATNNEPVNESVGDDEAVGSDLTTEEIAEAERIGEDLANSVIGVVDEESLDSRAELHKKFDAAFRIIFGENYRDLESSNITFEYGTKRFYASLSHAISNSGE